MSARFHQAGRLIRDLHHLTVDSGSNQPGAANRLKHLEVLALAPSDQWSQELDLLPLFQPQQLAHDLFGSLAIDRRAARWTMRNAGPREQETQVVVDLSDGPECAPGIGCSRPLIDRDGRRQALDRVDVRTLELVQELAGVAREALEIAALPLGINRVERQRTLPRTADTRQDDQAISGQIDVDVLQIVHTCAANLDQWRRRRRA